MTAFIIRRVFFAVVVLFLITVMVFLALRILPGDPILMLVTSSQLSSYSQEQINKLRHEFGLDRPLIVQYFSWISGMFHGDFGISIINRTPVVNEIARRLPITINIGVISFIVGNVFGFAVGIASAVRRGSLLDNSITTGAYLGQAIPQFWLALVLVYIFGLQLRWLPIMGYTSPFVDLGMNIRQLILPVICECIGSMAMMARQVRSSMLEVIRQDYIRTAWSKGLDERTVMIKHALKNALIPIVTIAGMAIPMILGGSVFIETVFNIPGMGRLLVTAIQNKDYPYVQAITMITTTAVVFTNLLVDLAYGWLDPRVRYH